MLLSDIVVSLDLAQELKEAGYPQESLFYWETTKESQVPNGNVVTRQSKFLNQGDNMLEWYAAPTASELGEKLPFHFTSGKTLAFDKQEDKWNCYIHWHNFDNPELPKEIEHSEHGDTEANARAKCWLYLKKHNLLEK
jgi:hypothetical protein